MCISPVLLRYHVVIIQRLLFIFPGIIFDELQNEFSSHILIENPFFFIALKHGFKSLKWLNDCHMIARFHVLVD